LKKKVSRQSKKSTPANDTKATEALATLGKALYAHLTKRGKRLNKAAAARLLGITPLKVQALLDDQSDVDAELALKLGDAFKTDPEYWLAFQAARDLARARVARAVRADWDKPISHSPWWPDARYFWKAFHSEFGFKHVVVTPTLTLGLYEIRNLDRFTNQTADLRKHFRIFYLERLPNGQVTLWLDNTVEIRRRTPHSRWDIAYANLCRVSLSDRREIVDVARRILFEISWDGQIEYFAHRQSATSNPFPPSSIQ
jgi:addiction module HigA family antidote